jgi:hypothetical protein
MCHGHQTLCRKRTSMHHYYWFGGFGRTMSCITTPHEDFDYHLRIDMLRISYILEDSKRTHGGCLWLGHSGWYRTSLRPLRLAQQVHDNLELREAETVEDKKPNGCMVELERKHQQSWSISFSDFLLWRFEGGRREMVEAISGDSKQLHCHCFTTRGLFWDVCK